MRKVRKQIETIARGIKLLILDVDGVMTDGGIILDNKGNELKVFHVRDGHGIKMLQMAGIKVAIVTGRSSDVVLKRAKELDISDVYQGVFKKSIIYEKLLKKYKLKDNEVAFMGDDVVDIEILKRVGLPAVPRDADEEVKGFAKFISSKDGGRGAVREFIDFILKSKGLWGSASGESLG
ncbi:MAG: hypothetical protein Fur0020_02840 [Thermodesulfovibrionia bacterium]